MPLPPPPPKKNSKAQEIFLASKILSARGFLCIWFYALRHPINNLSAQRPPITVTGPAWTHPSCPWPGTDRWERGNFRC